MKIALGSDHAGYKLKEYIKKYFIQKGFEVIDVSPVQKEGDDYPDHVKKFVKKVLSEKIKGVLLCGTGTGVTIAANRFKGIRAALILDDYSAKKSRSSNDANVACLRGWNLGKERALRLVKLFLKTPFDKEPRRIRRIRKLEKLK